GGGVYGSIGAGGIQPRNATGVLPVLQNRLRPPPRRFHLVAAHEQRGVTTHHVHQQPLVRVGGAALERLRVVERQRDWSHPDAARPRLFRRHLQVHLFVWLQGDDQPVRLGCAVAAREHRQRNG